MCSRFSFVATQEEIESKFGVSLQNPLRTSYNIGPTQHAYIITNDKQNSLQYVTWGLIPSWSETGRNTGRLINARKENIGGQTSFRIPIRKKRCLVLADSFYEWRQDGINKIPYRVKLKSGELMVMAGIWDEWSDGQYGLKSFSIITTDANQEMKEIFSRMPVLLLTPESQKQWLSEMSITQTVDMLQTPPNDTLYMYRVSKRINELSYNNVLLHKNLIS